MKTSSARLLFTFFAVLTTLDVCGQTDLHQVKHGLQFGLTSSNLLDDDQELLPQRQEQFYFGYYRETRFLGLLKFKVGLQFLQTGAVEKDVSEIKLSYLCIPAALKLSVGPFYGEGGFSGSVRVAADEFENGQKVDTSGKYNTWDGGFFFGAGAELLIFFVEFRQTWGRVGVVDGYFSKYWQIGGGIRF